MKVCEINNLYVNFKMKKGFIKYDELRVLSNVNLEIEENDVFGIVGESGCGKSTLCNTILGFVKKDSGLIKLFDHELSYDKKELKEYRENIDVIFQNPFSSLNQRLKVWEIITEPLYIKGEKDQEFLKGKALEMLLEVGLNKDDLERYVFEFSGGQRQRIAIARSLINHPKFIILDEPTSALDVSIQAQIANLLLELKQKYDLTYLFVSHNLALIYQLTNKVAVMYAGQIVECGDTKEVFMNPKHPYTKGLISSILDPKTDNVNHFYFNLEGETTSTINAPKTCRFYNRCPFKCDDCLNHDVLLEKVSDNHLSSCTKDKK